MARKLKPGGLLILTSDYYFDSSWKRPAFFIKTDIEKELAQIKKQYGFKELRAEHVGKDWTVHAVMNPSETITVKGDPVEAAGMEFLVFNLPGGVIKIQEKAIGGEVELKEAMSDLRKLEVLTKDLELDEDVALILLKKAGIRRGKELLLSFAKEKGGKDPLEFLQGELERGRTAKEPLDLSV